MVNIYRRRRAVTALLCLVIMIFVIIANSPIQSSQMRNTSVQVTNSGLAIKGLEKLAIKGRASKSNYSRDQFGSGWSNTGNCDTRNIILYRDLTNAVVNDNCVVTGGTLNDPYTGKVIKFKRGSKTSADIQIDHVVALSDAWQKGAQALDLTTRVKLTNDPLELLAVSGGANQQKGDGDAATWLPLNKNFRCQYVARQIAVKIKYSLWITSAEHDAMNKILVKCENQVLPTP